MSKKECSLSVEFNRNKFMERLPDIFKVEFKTGNPESPEEAYQTTKHVLGVIIGALEESKEDTEFLAKMAHALHITPHWGKEEKAKMIDDMLERDGDVDDEQKELISKLLKKLLED